jgi:hypothetical protein
MKANVPADLNWTAGFAGALAISPSDASPEEAPQSGDLRLQISSGDVWRSSRRASFSCEIVRGVKCVRIPFLTMTHLSEKRPPTTQSHAFI